MNKNVILCAHRGYRQKFPENTMLAFKEAFKLDIDALEFDVRMTNDYEMVIMHDPNLDRTTDAHGHVCDRSLEQVRKADAGIKFGEQFKGERVPTLEEVLELAQTRPDIRIMLELKDYPEEYGDFAYVSCERAVALCKKYGIWGRDRITIVTFSTMLCAWLKKRYGHENVQIQGFYPKFVMKGCDKDEPYHYYDEICLFPEKRTMEGKPWWQKSPVVDKQIFDNFSMMGIIPCCYFAWNTVEEDYKLAYDYGCKCFTADDPYTVGLILDKIGARKLKK